MKIDYIDRKSGALRQEDVYGGKAIQLIWGNSWIGALIRNLVSHFPTFSALYGWCQRRPSSKKKIGPFIETFGVDSTEFDNSFASFNDFFIRKLKPGARPIDPDPKKLIAPADARYYFYQNISDLTVKGKSYTLETLLQNPELAKKYENGSCLTARLCPSDYHRFHFPCTGTPKKAHLIPGALFSVNPLATKVRPTILAENRRMVTAIDSQEFGQIVYIEVGATNVGAIHQTFTPNQVAKKGSEKGYFSFGGSALVLLFEKGSLTFDQDILENTQKGIETYCQLGESIGIK